jgi:hypothetical protein
MPTYELAALTPVVAGIDAAGPWLQEVSIDVEPAAFVQSVVLFPTTKSP